MLMPKRVKFRRQHRGRMTGQATKGSKISFGEYGLKAMEPCWITTRQIEAGRIAVRTVPRLSEPFEEVLDLYGIETGDKAVVRLAQQAADVEATVTDDRLLVLVQKTPFRPHHIPTRKGTYPY